METPGQRIRLARKASGLSQDALADALGVSKATVSSWERDDSNPRFDLLAELRHALATSIDWIVSGDRTGAPPSRAADEAMPLVLPTDEAAAFQYAVPFSADAAVQALGLAEFRLVSRFRDLPPRKRQALLDLLGE